MFAGFSGTKLYMPYIWCSLEREYVVRLSTLVVLIQIALGPLSHFGIYAIIGWSRDVPLFFQLLRRLRICDFERQIRIARQAVFSGWHNVEMFAICSASFGLPYASVSERWSGDEF